MPIEVQDFFFTALQEAAEGGKPESAKPLAGFGGAKVMQISKRQNKGAYRSIYTIEFHNFIVVLHAFEKKSKGGIETPKEEIDLVKVRLKEVRKHFK